MISDKKIIGIYNQFKKDLNINIQMPQLNIIRKVKYENVSAYIGVITSEFAEIYLGDIFSQIGISHKYLACILYHEFTHIFDRLSFVLNETNPRKHCNLLFPYTEFHASQIELMKALNLFEKSNRKITMFTLITDKYIVRSIRKSLMKEYDNFILYSKILRKNPNIKNVQNIVYLLVYNIGYSAIYSRYDISNKLPLSKYPYIKESVVELTDLLANNSPTDDLCIKTNKIANEIATQIARCYKVL